MIIRENIELYMAELRQWLETVKNEPPEAMDAFFNARIAGYEEHMQIWADAYRRFAQLLPIPPGQILDLGVGTGLELDEIWTRDPAIPVTGVDMSRAMLDQLAQKHSDKDLQLICDDYFHYDMGESKWDTVISFESFHHFLHDEKLALYRKIFWGLKPGGSLLLGDYIACCNEEEELLRSVYLEKRKRYAIPAGKFIHMDIPMTLEHGTAILKEAGFQSVTPLDSIAGATILIAAK